VLETFNVTVNQFLYVSKVKETTSSSKRLVFAQVADGDLRVFFRSILDERTENGLVIVTNDEDLLDVVDLGDSAETVFDDGVTGDFEERLCDVNCVFFLLFVCFSFLTLGTSRERGLKRVPRDGPPTRMTAFVVLLDIL